MIQKEIVNLYEHFSFPQGDASGGSLSCYYWNTPNVISSSRKRPGVLILPGGGYCHCSPRESEPVAARFLARGYAVFILTYSTAPSTFPTALQEAAMAMAYLRQNSLVLELDKIAAIGFSAGGHLCGCLGTLFDHPAVQSLQLPADPRPDALGLCYPVAVSWGSTHEGSFEAVTGGDQELRRMLSLDSLVRPDMPPVYIWHTQSDATVPVRNSLILASALEEKNVPFSLHIYPTGPHGLSTGDIQSYHQQKIPKISEYATDWPEFMMSFFAEFGFSITDKEVCQ